MAKEGHLIDYDEIENFKLRDAWNSPRTTREQKIVLLKLFCGLDDIKEIENFHSFDDALFYAKFPALQKKYLDLMNDM